MIECKATVAAAAGLHARPASLLANRLKAFNGNAELIVGEKKANMKSLIGIMGLGIKKDTEVTIQVCGDEEESIATELAEIISTYRD